MGQCELTSCSPAFVVQYLPPYQQFLVLFDTTAGGIWPQAHWAHASWKRHVMKSMWVPFRDGWGTQGYSKILPSISSQGRYCPWCGWGVVARYCLIIFPASNISVHVNNPQRLFKTKTYFPIWAILTWWQNKSLLVGQKTSNWKNNNPVILNQTSHGWLHVVEGTRSFEPSNWWL